MNNAPDNILSFGWPLVIAICLVVVAVCHLIDFILKKHEVKKLHSFFLRLADKLEYTKLTEWQAQISDFSVHIFDKAAGALIAPFSFIAWFLDMLRWMVTKYKYPHANWILALCTIIALITVFGVPVLFFFTGIWWLGVLTYPFLVMFIISVCAIFLYFLYNEPKFNDVYNKVLQITIASSLFSLLALSVTVIFFDTIPPNTAWFLKNGNTLSPTRPLVLSLINFPFDALTIAITLKLLRHVAKQKKHITFMALLDVFLSALLTVLLYATLLVAEHDWDVAGFLSYVKQSIGWFHDIGVTACHSFKDGQGLSYIAGFKDIHLLPVLLTTLIPVTAYMSFFLFVSGCKPIMIMANRVLSVVGEREESVFKQFGVLAAVLLAAVKAIYDLVSTWL